MSRYALWIEPPAYLAVRLNALIDALAIANGGPRFTAHITLLGGLEAPAGELLSALGGLVQGLRPFEVRLGEIGTGEEYFRAIYLKAESSDAFMEARRLAEGAFAHFFPESATLSAFMPHMSLFYGDLDEQRKGDIIRGMGGGLAASFRVEGLSLYRTGGPPDEWARVGEVVRFSA